MSSSILLSLIQLGTYKLTQLLLGQFDRIILKILITNIIWNVLFLLILILNSTVLTFKVLLIYYLINNGLLLYACIKLLIQLNKTPNIEIQFVPNIWTNMHTYLTIVTILLTSEAISIIFDLNLDLLIYGLLAIVTLYYITFHNIKTILNVSLTLIKIHPRLKTYILLYVIENMITFGIYLLW